MKRKNITCLLLILTVFFLTGVNAYAKKPEVTRHDAQYLDKQISINLQWQSSEAIVSIRVAAGKDIKDVKVDPYENKRNRSGYTGEVNVVLQAEPAGSQDSIPYTIQLEDEDGQKSVISMGKAAIPPTSAVAAADDQWGKEKLTSSQQSVQKDMIEQLRAVAQVLASPPFLHEVTVNAGPGAVTFRTKATHSVALKEISFRVFDSGNKQVDTQQISATGKVWDGTSKDFSLMNGDYSVIVQAVDGSGSTSPERRMAFKVTGSTLTEQPTPSPGNGSNPGGTQPSPTPIDSLILTVNILPPDVLASGAQWRVGSMGTMGEWKNSGESITSIPANGSYDVEFKDVAGWKKPDNMKVDLETGKTNTIAGEYSKIVP